MAAGSTKVVLSAIAGNSVITVTKSIGWFFTMSPSMLAEAIHSLADTANQILLYIGLRHSRLGPTREFPWGRSNAQYVWNLISCVGIFFLGFGITAYHGIHSLMDSGEFTGYSNLKLLGGVLLFAFVVEAYVFWVAFKEVWKQKGTQPFFRFMKNSDDPTTIAILLEDGIAVSGVVIAALGIFFSIILKSNVPDGIASLVIAVLLGVMAIMLAKTNAKFLIGKAASEASEKDIRKFLMQQASVEEIISLKTEVMGPGLLRLALEVEFHGSLLVDRNKLETDANEIKKGARPLPILVDTAERTVRSVGHQINELENLLHARFPQLKVINLEVH